MDIKNYRIFKFRTADKGTKVMVADRDECKVIAIIRTNDNRHINLEVNSDKLGISTVGQVSYYKPADLEKYTDEQIMNMVIYDGQILMAEKQ